MTYAPEYDGGQCYERNKPLNASEAVTNRANGYDCCASAGSEGYEEEEPDEKD